MISEFARDSVMTFMTYLLCPDPRLLSSARRDSIVLIRCKSSVSFGFGLLPGGGAAAGCGSIGFGSARVAAYGS